MGQTRKIAGGERTKCADSTVRLRAVEDTQESEATCTGAIVAIYGLRNCPFSHVRVVNLFSQSVRPEKGLSYLSMEEEERRKQANSGSLPRGLARLLYDQVDGYALLQHYASHCIAYIA